MGKEDCNHCSLSICFEYAFLYATFLSFAKGSKRFVLGGKGFCRRFSYLSEAAGKLCFSLKLVAD